MKARLTLPALGLIATPLGAQTADIPDFSICKTANLRISCIESYELDYLAECRNDSCRALVIASANRTRHIVILSLIKDLEDRTDFNTGFGAGAIIFSD